MTANGADNPPTTGRIVHRQKTVEVPYFLVLGIIAGFVGLWLEFGLLVGLGVAGVDNLLMRAPVFALRGRTTLRTDRSHAAVREELSSPRNPLTALWFEAADAVEDCDEGVARLTATGRTGLVEREWVVAVVDEDPLRLTIRRDGTVLVATTVAVEGDGDWSRVTIDGDRVRVGPLTLLKVAASGAQYLAHFAANGYELVDEERSIGFARRRESERQPGDPAAGR